MFKGQKGVTLVALVVTIIVLLILAGVSISMVVGQNGILTRTQGSVNNQNAASAREKLSMAISSIEMGYNTAWASNTNLVRTDYYTSDLLKTELVNNGCANDSGVTDGSLTGANGATVKVNMNGNYTFTKVKVDSNGALTMDAVVTCPDGKTVTLSNQ